MINITQIKQTKMAAPKMGRSVRQSASNIPNAGPGDTFPPKFVKIDRAAFAKSCYSKQTKRKQPPWRIDMLTRDKKRYIHETTAIETMHT